MFPPQFDLIDDRMTISEQQPAAGLSLITLARRRTAAFLSHLMRKSPVVVRSVSPEVRESRVTPLYRRRRSIPSYLGKICWRLCLEVYYNSVCQDLDQLRHRGVEAARMAPLRHRDFYYALTGQSMHLVSFETLSS